MNHTKFWAHSDNELLREADKSDDQLTIELSLRWEAALDQVEEHLREIDVLTNEYDAQTETLNAEQDKRLHAENMVALLQDELAALRAQLAA